MNEFKFESFEVWEDFWCFRPKAKIELKILGILNYTSRSVGSEFEFWIEKHQEKESPTNYQVQTFEYIINNQEKILQSIFTYYKNVILPVYQEATDIEEQDIARSKLELSKVFGLLFIKIPNIENSKDFNYIIEFDFNYDDEHGNCILFQNGKAIDFFEGGEDNYDAIKLYKEEVNQGEPIPTNLYHLNGETVFRESYKFDEKIFFNLKKGTYRTFIHLDGRELCRNFYVPNNLTEFTLRQILTMN